MIVAEHFNEEQLLFFIRNQLKDYDLSLLRFQTNRKGRPYEICAIDVDEVHLPFNPDVGDCVSVRDILEGKGSKEGGLITSTNDLAENGRKGL